MKFKYKLPIYFTVLLIVCTALLCADIFYTVFKMFNLFGLMSASLIREIVTVLMCVIFVVLALLLLTVRYKISDDLLTLKIGTFDILGKKVTTNKILNIVLKKHENKLYLSYIGKNVDPTIMLIAIKPSKYKDFCDYLMLKNSNIIYFEDERS